MDLDSMPELYKEAFSQSLVNLEKLKEDDNIGHHKQADSQNLLNATQIQLLQVLEEVVTILPHIQITGGQEGLVNRSLTQMTAKWEESLRLSRNVMLIIDISNRKERGEMSYDMTIDLINTPLPELAGAVSVVPENIMRNIKEFTGLKTDVEDVDMILEGFLKSVSEAGQTGKLAHSAQKELIIRKLSPNCLLLVNSYLDTSNKAISDISLHQLIGILEQIYMPNCQPSEALVKLQRLGKVKNGDYLSQCAVISRLVRLSVRKEADDKSRKTLQESRSAEYMKSSLSESDYQLIRQQEIKRAEEQKPPLTALKIAKYLTQYHHNKIDSEDNFDFSTVNRVSGIERNASGSRTFERGKSQRGNFLKNNAQFASFRGQRGNFRHKNGPNRFPAYQHGNGGFPEENDDFQHQNGFQQGNRDFQYDNGKYQNQNDFQQGNRYVEQDNGHDYQNEDQYFSHENGDGQNNVDQGFDNDNEGQDYTQRGQNRHNTGQHYIVPMYKDAKVSKDECVMCGSRKHFWSSWRCKYRGIVGPTPRPREDIPAPVCRYHGQYLHPTEFCLGDIDVDGPDDTNKLRFVRSQNIPILAGNEESDFDEIDSDNDETISFK